MSEFIKAQSEVRNNLITQVREILDGAESESRGLLGEELTKVNAIEADIAKADEALSVAKRAEDRKVETAEAARDFRPSEATYSVRLPMARCVLTPSSLRSVRLSYLRLTLSQSVSWTASWTSLDSSGPCCRPLKSSSAPPENPCGFLR